MVRIGSVCLLGFIAQGVRTGAPANALQAPRIRHGGDPAEFARIGGVMPMTIDGGLADLPAQRTRHRTSSQSCRWQPHRASRTGATANQPVVGRWSGAQSASALP
jgi:hypothetical protein